MFGLCTPAIIYVIFSITQILFDTFKGLYNTALVKIVVMIIITFLLNILCQSGLGVISWIIVFIPFIFMTLLVTIILYIFGLKKTSGLINNKPIVNDNVNKKVNPNENVNIDNKIQVDKLGNIIIYKPNYDEIDNPIIYDEPYIIILNNGSDR